jgi:hypothetical protein
MKKSLLFLTFILATTIIFGQDIPKVYYDLVHKADSLYKSNDYKNAASSYSEAFQTIGWKGTSNDRYGAACCWALANVPDSAFFSLYRIATLMDYPYYGAIMSDVDLESLHRDSRWDPLVQIIKANRDKAEPNRNKQLVDLLDTIYIEDQIYRKQSKKIEAKFGFNSNQMETHWALIQKTDSVNLIKVTVILDSYGWLGPDSIGEQGSKTLFLVIQHSELAIQEKYLPLMRDAVQKGKAKGYDLALLEDRVALRNNKKQIYGSQIGRDTETLQYYVSPLEDPDNVDKRRTTVGLGPLAEYVSRWGIKWDVEQYKKELPNIESRRKALNK